MASTLPFSVQSPTRATRRCVQGVRRRLWIHHAQTPNFKIVPGSKTYREDFQRSLFCAAPLGEGWGIRLTWAVAYGCIPVVFRSRVRQFWDDRLTYTDFAVLVSKAEIPYLDRVLGNVTLHERERLRDGLAKYHRLFLWGTCQPPSCSRLAPD
eukprot:6042430-Pleurochrysis_carterae.AAC.4